MKITKEILERWISNGHRHLLRKRREARNQARTARPRRLGPGKGCILYAYDCPKSPHGLILVARVHRKDISARNLLIDWPEQYRRDHPELGLGPLMKDRMGGIRLEFDE